MPLLFISGLALMPFCLGLSLGGLTLGLLLLGAFLCPAAGGNQGLRAEDGIGLGDMLRLLAWSQPLAATAAVIARVCGTVTLHALAGGLAVPVFAGMRAVYHLFGFADFLSRDLTTTPEVTT